MKIRPSRLVELSPKNKTVDVENRIDAVMIQWHRDEVTPLKEAREMGQRLIKRLAEYGLVIVEDPRYWTDEATELVEELRPRGLTSEDLDEVVDALASEEASSVNNADMIAQVIKIIQQVGLSQATDMLNSCLLKGI